MAVSTQALPMLPKDLKIIMDYLDGAEARQALSETCRLCFKAFLSTAFTLWTRYAAWMNLTISLFLINLVWTSGMMNSSIFSINTSTHLKDPHQGLHTMRFTLCSGKPIKIQQKVSTVTFQKIFKWLIVRKAKYTISHKISNILKLIVIHICLCGSPISQPVFSNPSQTLITSFLPSHPQIYSNLVNQWAAQVLKVWWMRLLKGLAWWMEEMGNSQCIAFGMVEHSTDSCGLSGNGV